MPKRGWLGDRCRGSGATPEVDREERCAERAVIITPHPRFHLLLFSSFFSTARWISSSFLYIPHP